MDKNNLIELSLKEIKEIEMLLKGLTGLEHIPQIMLQLADDKILSIRNMLAVLGNNESIDQDNTGKVKEEDKLISKIVNIETVTEFETTFMTDENAVFPENTGTEATETFFMPDENPVFIENTEVETVNTTDANIEDVVQENVFSEIEETLTGEETMEKEESIKIETPPAPEKEEQIIVEKKTEKIQKKTIIGETIIEKKSSVNEKLSTKANTPVSSQKITDLKKSINLNDKFRFQRELFNGNPDLFMKTLDALNGMSTKEEALGYLDAFEWDRDSQTAIDFIELINRKFL